MLLTLRTVDIFERRLANTGAYRESTVAYYRQVVSGFSRYCTSRGTVQLNDAVRKEYFSYLDKIY